MREKRDEVIILRLTKTEKHRIYEKMLGMGIRSLSAYIRKMKFETNCLASSPRILIIGLIIRQCKIS